ncbi:MAG: adenylyltransferase/cytidyltransferase family protein [bacterium]|nr:adenylyltransferase/cytidyltransferase family protein [bacterium]
MVFGVFDRLHPGHLFFLRRASSYGDRLIAIVARASAVSMLKKKIPSDPEKTRLKGLRRLDAVWRAILGDREQGTYTVVRKYKPAVICLGYDQRALGRDIREKIKFGMLPRIRLIRIRAYRPEKYHTRLL